MSSSNVTFGGKPISLEEARAILNTRKECVDKMDLPLKIATGILHEPTVTHYYLGNQNGFLFSKAELLQLIESEAPYYMVIAGAHSEKSTAFQKGDPTVMIIPCTLLKDSNGEETNGSTVLATGLLPQSKKGTSKVGDPTDPVGLEHPPATNVTNINLV
ncbi:hypothetical protein [Chitinophaga sp. Cy-1792]|uniref:hypothetical protein n=1 Tax=Chitinophaga sp. Cy-1792 TaxID=2608339 RepID=UPI00141EBAFE|nr:hypothetical protein [Chitinophaga sp. Cy-1792]NIG53813.1 hypothetical protein [Chitinophaga sp. Cy-1792]